MEQSGGALLRTVGWEGYTGHSCHKGEFLNILGSRTLVDMKNLQTPENTCISNQPCCPMGVFLFVLLCALEIGFCVWKDWFRKDFSFYNVLNLCKLQFLKILLS